MSGALDGQAVAARALPLLDLTNLNDDCTEADIDALCARTETAHGHVAAVCVWPRFVTQSRKRLKGTDIRVATVCNFPAGGTDVDAAVAEARTSAFDGAHEVDVVLPYRQFADGEQDVAMALVAAVKDTLPETVRLKVIIETGALKVPELVRIASVKAIDAGADFIKTSTGKVPVNATLEAAQIMLDVIQERVDGKAIGFKPAGGIKTVADAGAYLALADEILGPDWVTPETFRFGASSLLDVLLAELDGSVATPSEGY
ncbi:MAG: deoxyribose-phosphate aldolase [Pseudomonadota bacterium]